MADKTGKEFNKESSKPIHQRQPKLEIERQPVLSRRSANTLPSLLQRSQVDPLSLAPAELNLLQTTIGMRAMRRLAAQNPSHAGQPQAGLSPAMTHKADSQASLQRMLAIRGMVIQTKLTVGAVNDRYEQEADKVANQVARGGQQLAARQASGSKALLAQRFSQAVSRAGGPVDRPMQSRIQREQGGGQALDQKVGTQLGMTLGADFSQVHVHTDNTADELNRSLSARAFTTGRDIFFSKGAYDPGSASGKHLLAHELTHVVQQGAAPADAVQQQAGPGSINRSMGDAFIQREGGKDSQEGGQSHPESEAPEHEVEESQPSGKLTPQVQSQIEQLVGDLPPESDLAKKEKQKEEVAEQAKQQAEEEGLPVVRGKESLAKIIVEANGGEQQVKEPEEESTVKPKTGWRSWFRGRGANANTTVRIGSGLTGKGATGALHFGKLGMDATSTASKVLGIAGVVGAIFQAIAAGLDIRSAHSSRKKSKALNEIITDAKGSGVAPEVIDAVTNAMKAKYKKFWYKVVTASMNLAGVILTTTLSAVGGVALLATNPVGWAIAGALALAGIAFFTYRVVNWFRKRRSGQLGQKRQKTAETLFNALVDAQGRDRVGVGQATARRALSELGLRGEDWLKQWNNNEDRSSREQLKNVAVGEIMRKLKWT